MSLSTNVKRYRLDFGPSQECMASALNMSQPKYSRIENSDMCCAKHLASIANALGTTPDVLRTYQPDGPPQQTPDAELLAAQTLIAQQQQQIEQHLTTIRHWEQVWHKHCGGGQNL